MNPIVKFFHEMFNPHCAHCETLQLMTDPVIDELKTELTALRYERDRLLKYILDDKPQSTYDSGHVPSTEEPEPITPKVVPWRVRQQMLESEDRRQASLIKQSKKEQEEAIAKLEKEMSVEVPGLDLEKGEVNVQSKSV